MVPSMCKFPPKPWGWDIPSAHLLRKNHALFLPCLMSFHHFPPPFGNLVNVFNKPVNPLNSLPLSMPQDQFLPGYTPLCEFQPHILTSASASTKTRCGGVRTVMTCWVMYWWPMASSKSNMAGPFLTLIGGFSGKIIYKYLNRWFSVAM